MLDRLDIHIDVPRVEYEKLASDRVGEASPTIRQRIIVARARQQARFNGSGPSCNADMTPAHIREFCKLDDPANR